MCEPSTSASVMMMILWYRTLPASKSCRDAGAERGDERADLGGGEHLVQARLLDVQDLAPQRQDRLGAPVAALFARAAGRVALDDEELRERGVLLLAVGELSGERARVERALAADQLAGLARRLARARRLHDLLDDLLADPRVLLEVRAELVVDDLLDPGLDLGRDELVLRLRGELGVADLHGDDRGQALAAVVAGERRLLQSLGQAVGLGVLLDGARERGLESLEVRAAVAVVDRVREREQRLGVALVPLDRDLDALLVGVALGIPGPVLDVLEEDDLVVDRLLRLVQVLDEGPDPALVGEVVLLLRALVDDRDARRPGSGTRARAAAARGCRSGTR